MSELLSIFLIIALGILFGRIRIKGIGLGMSAIMIVALVFGHLGISTSSIIRDFGLVCFISTVGIMSGPTFFADLKNKVLKYLLTGVLMIVLTAVICVLVLKISGLPLPLLLGLMAGALSSTPCLATALEITGSSLVFVGYGIAYPFGVVGVVLLVQLISKLNLSANQARITERPEDRSRETRLFSLDRSSIVLIAASAVLGIFLGSRSFPLSDHISFSFGISGGALLCGLIIGSLSHRYIEINRRSLETVRELGLALFLCCAGTQAGNGFVATIDEYGIILFLIGVFMSIVPIVCGFLIAYSVFRLDKYSALGTVCGGMTSTTALGSLSKLDGYEKIAAGYAATYTVALISIVIATQIIFILFS